MIAPASAEGVPTHHAPTSNDHLRRNHSDNHPRCDSIAVRPEDRPPGTVPRARSRPPACRGRFHAHVSPVWQPGDVTQTKPANPLVGSVENSPEPVARLTVAPALVSAGITTEAADRLAYILDQVYFEGAERTERLRRFAALIVLSTMIATFGLLSDSVAVVIGAMLVAPLMTPILGTAVSLVLTEAPRLVMSLLTVLAGAAGAILVGWFISFLSAGAISVDNLPGEVAGRTAPGLFDLGIAVAAGLTGGYLMVDRKAAASAAGVAIAVALVPPLAVVGICIELGSWSLAGGALLLFSTNFAAIVFAASLVVAASGVIPRGFLRFRVRVLRTGFAVVAVAVVAVAVPLAVHTANVVEQQTFQQLVVDAVGDWDPRALVQSITTERGAVWSVDLQVSTPADRNSAWQLAEMITERSGKTVELDLAFVTEEEDRASTR